MALPRPYRYEPLSKPNDVRLLYILPGADGEPLSISLHIVNLSDSPDFEALSYVWGDPKSHKEILCNGYSVRVTANLHDALNQLRLPDHPRTLWADALCINQADLDEKSLQIQIMHLIYKSCRRCVIWLGLADEHTDAALDIVQLMAEIFCKSLNISQEEMDNHLKTEGRDVTKALEIGHSELLPPKDSPKWISLFSFLCRQWFTRIWVIQEAIFAPDLLFHCGARTCQYSALYYTADWIMVNGQPISYILKFAGPDWHGPNRYNIMYMRQDDYVRRTQRLASLLNNFREYHATNPRDKIYALIHMPAFQREYPDIKPDYRIPTEAVYIDVALRVLQGSRDLHLLTMIHDNGKNADDEALHLPSWVPRWHDPQVTKNVSFSWYQLMSASGKSEKAKAAHCVSLSAPLDPCCRPAATSLLPSISKSFHPFTSSSPKAYDNLALPRTVLGIRGFEFDTVQDVCELEFWGDRVPNVPRIPLFRTRTGPWERYRPRKAGDSSSSESPLPPPPSSSLKECPYATEPEVIDAYAMTLTASCRAYRGVYPIRCPEAHYANHAADFVAFLTWARTLGLGEDGARVTTTTTTGQQLVPPRGDFYPPGLYAAERPTLLDADAHEVAAMSLSYSIMACNYSMDRCLYRTRRGYLGTGPRDVQRGDVVCVLMGGAVPFILRRRGDDDDDGYTLIGDAYVHGVMDGELVKDWEEGKAELELREFCIH